MSAAVGDITEVSEAEEVTVAGKEVSEPAVTSVKSAALYTIEGGAVVEAIVKPTVLAMDTPFRATQQVLFSRPQQNEPSPHCVTLTVLES